MVALIRFKIAGAILAIIVLASVFLPFHALLAIMGVGGVLAGLWLIFVSPFKGILLIAVGGLAFVVGRKLHARELDREAAAIEEDAHQPWRHVNNIESFSDDDD